jgi:hypothetical protein
VDIKWAGSPATKALGTGAYHAEQLLLTWAQSKGYAILSIAPTMKDACSLCSAVLQAASDAQVRALGFPIFFY